MSVDGAAVTSKQILAGASGEWRRSNARFKCLLVAGNLRTQIGSTEEFEIRVISSALLLSPSLPRIA